jgi:phosphoheptose isomerase
MDEFNFLQHYFEQFQRLYCGPDDLVRNLMTAKELVVDAAKRGNKIILIGNGGSASIASHVAVGLTKNAQIRAMNCNIEEPTIS